MVYIAQIFFFKLGITKHLNQAMKRLCLQVILLPKAHTQRKQIYLSYQSTKAYPKIVPGAHKDFQSTYAGHTHAVQSSQKVFPHSHF